MSVLQLSVSFWWQWTLRLQWLLKTSPSCACAFFKSWSSHLLQPARKTRYCPRCWAKHLKICWLKSGTLISVINNPEEAKACFSWSRLLGQHKSYDSCLCRLQIRDNCFPFFTVLWWLWPLLFKTRLCLVFFSPQIWDLRKVVLKSCALVILGKLLVLSTAL